MRINKNKMLLFDITKLNRTQTNMNDEKFIIHDAEIFLSLFMLKIKYLFSEKKFCSSQKSEEAFLSNTCHYEKSHETQEKYVVQGFRKFSIRRLQFKQQ